MINIYENLEKILPYRPSWTDDDKAKYVNDLLTLNDNYDKLLPVHIYIIDDAIHKFGFVSDMNVEFILQYLTRGNDDD